MRLFLVLLLSIFLVSCGTPMGKIKDGTEVLLSVSKIVSFGNDYGIKRKTNVFVSYTSGGVQGELQGMLHKVKKETVIIINEYGNKVSIPRDNISYISEW